MQHGTDSPKTLNDPGQKSFDVVVAAENTDASLAVLRRKLDAEIVRRKAAEQEFEHREALLAEAQALAHLGSWEWDLQNNRGTWSEEMCRIFGVSSASQTAPGATVLSFVHEEDRARVQQTVAEALSGKTPQYSCEYRIRSADGTERIVVSRGIVYRDARGNAVRMSGMVQDITDRKQREQALLDSEERYRKLVEFSPDPLFITCRGKITFVNHAGVTLFGASSADQLIGHSILRFVHPDSRALARSRVAAMEQTRRPQPAVEQTYVGLNGTPVEVEVTALPFEIDGQPAAQLVVHDLTSRKRAERQVAFQSSLLDQVRDAVVATDLQGRVTFWNKYAETLYQWSREEALGRNIIELIIPPENVPAAKSILEGVDTRGYWEGEFPVRRKDGTIFPAYVVDTLIRDAAGGPAGYIGVSVDMTERHRTEAALKENELRYRTMIELSTDLIWTLDLKGNFTFVSRRCEEVSGYRFEDFKGRPFSSLAVEEDLPRMWQVFASVAAGERQPFEVRVKRADGSVFLVEGTSAPIWQDNLIVGVVAFGRDVTQERRMLEALQLNEERFRLVTLATNDGIWDYDLTTGNCWWNDRFEQLFGPGPADSREFYQWWTASIDERDRNRVVGSFEQSLHGCHSQWSCEYRFILPKGVSKFVYDRAHIVRNSAGKALRAVGAMLDLTERRDAQEQLRKLSNQLVQVQEEERRRIARELHDSTAQKLAGVMMNLGLLEDACQDRRLEPGKILSECLSGVEDCAQEIRTLSYLLHPPLLDELGLEVALDTYASGFAQRSGIQVRLELDRLPIQPSREASLALFRIVQESLANTLRHSGSRTASIKLAGIRNRVILEVCDEGHGMPPELLARPPQQWNGFGVGIMGMRERLAQLGGTLEIDSSSSGTTIRAIVPVTEANS